MGYWKDIDLCMAESARPRSPRLAPASFTGELATYRQFGGYQAADAVTVGEYDLAFLIARAVGTLGPDGLTPDVRSYGRARVTVEFLDEE